VDAVDAIDGGLTFGGRTEREGQHRLDGRVKARVARGGLVAKGAVVSDAGGDHRVRDLHEDRAAPAQDDEPLSVDELGTRHAGTYSRSPCRNAL
jgi:hypothetical protein